MNKKIVIGLIILLVVGSGYFVLKNYRHSVITSEMQKDPAYEQLQNDFAVKIEKSPLSSNIEIKLYLTSQARQDSIDKDSDFKGLLGGFTSIPVLTLVHKYVKDFAQVEITMFDKNSNLIGHSIITREDLTNLVRQGVIK